MLALVSVAVITGGCGPSPTAPAAGATDIVVTGPQVLRIVPQSSCTQLGQGVIPLVYTRVNVTRSANEWIAAASSAAAGDIQVHFHQSGANVVSGSIPVLGTAAGTAVHMPDLFPGAAFELRATFGETASLNGVAFVAGAFGATTAGLDGTGSGSFTLTDPTGKTCTGTTFSWSIFPVS